MSERIAGIAPISITVTWPDGVTGEIELDVPFEGTFDEWEGDNITPGGSEIDNIELDETEEQLLARVAAEFDDTPDDPRPILDATIYSQVEDAVWASVNDDVSAYLVDRD